MDDALYIAVCSVWCGAISANMLVMPRLCLENC